MLYNYYKHNFIIFKNCNKYIINKKKIDKEC